MASISSMNIIEGACSDATLNSSRTNLGPYLKINFKNVENRLFKNWK